MSDTDRILSSIHNQGATRRLEDGCPTCGFSRVYCHAVAYIEGNGALCCDNCSGH